MQAIKFLRSLLMADLASLKISIDTTDIKKAQKELGALGNAANDVQKQNTGLEKSTDKLNGRLRDSKDRFVGASNAANDYNRTIKKSRSETSQLNAILKRGAQALAAFATVASAQAVANIADEMANLKSRIDIAANAVGEYNKVQGDLVAIANTTRNDIGDLANLYARLINPIKALGGDSEQALGITQALSASLVLSGASAEEASSAITQFSQAMAGGVLRGEEFNALTDSAPVLLDNLAKQLGVTRGELREMAGAGQLTADVVGNALLNSVDSITSKVEQMAPTVSGAMTVLKNEFKLAVEKINEESNFQLGIVGLVDGVRKLIPLIGDGLSNAIKTSKSLFEPFAQLFNVVFGLAKNIVTAFFNVAAQVRDVLVNSGALKDIFSFVAHVAELFANALTIGSAVVVKTGGLIVSSLITPFEYLIGLVSKAARLLGQEGIANGLDTAKQAFIDGITAADTWSQGILDAVGAGNVNVLGFSDTVENANDKIITSNDSVLKSYADVGKLIQENSSNAEKSAEKQKNAEKKLQQETAKTRAAYGDVAKGVKQFAGQHTAAYKVVETTEKAFTAFNLAQSAIRVAQNVSEAVSKAAAQTGIGAPAAIGVVLAALAAAGVSRSGGGGGSSFVDNTGTGTVLGDSSAQSESLKAFEKLEERSSLGNRISSAMLSNLQDINAKMGGLAGIVSQRTSGINVNTGTSVSALGGAASSIGRATGDILTLGTNAFGISDLLGDIFGSVFGKTKVSLKQQGLALNQDLTDILQNGADVLEFARVKIKKKSLFGSSSKNKTIFSDAGDEISDQFTQIFTGVVDSLDLARESLGLSGSAFQQALQNISVNLGQIDLKGLSGEEIQEKLTAVFGAASDKIARQLIGGLDAFQQVGEGYFQTVTRVASGIEDADAVLTRLGRTAIDYTQIANTQGDVAAEIVRQSILQTETASQAISGGVYDMIQSLQGSAEEIEEAITIFDNLRHIMRGVGVDVQLLTASFIQAAGGIESLTDGLETYYSEFFSESERFANELSEVSQQFARIGQVMPESREAFRALVESAQELGDSNLVAQLISLAPAFNNLAKETESLVRSLEQEIVRTFNALKQNVKTLEGELRTLFSQEESRLSGISRKFSDISKTLGDFIDGLFKSVDSPVVSLQKLQNEFKRTSTLAQLGNAEAMARLPQIGNELAAATIAGASTRAEAQQALARIAAEAAKAQAVADAQVDVADLQLEELRNIVGELINLQNSSAGFVDAIGGNTSATGNVERKAEELRAAQRELLEAETAIIDAGFGSLINVSNQQVNALGANNTALINLNSAIADLIGVEQKKRADAERNQQIANLETEGQNIVSSVQASQQATGQARVRVDQLEKDIFALARGWGLYLNNKSGAADLRNTANFEIGANGEIIQQYAQISGKGNVSARSQAFNNDLFAAGGLYEQLQGEFNAQRARNRSVSSEQQRLEGLRSQIRDLGGVPSFNTGGMFGGGLRLVGESGPELEYTGPSRIFNAGQTSSMLDNSDMVMELKSLRDEMKMCLYQVAKNTGNTAKYLDRWDGDGLPEERVL